MKRFIFLTFAFMGWGFYELSGGADFQAGPDLASAQAAPSASEPDVGARADTSGNDLIKLTPAPEVPELDITLASVDRAPTPQAEAEADAEQLAALVAEGISASETDTVAGSDAADAPEETDTAGNAGVLYSIDDFNRTATATQDVREVSGSRVNLRNGPGTNFSVVDQLGRGDEVIVLQNTGDGWLKLKVPAPNRVGWMADFLVTASAE